MFPNKLKSLLSLSLSLSTRYFGGNLLDVRILQHALCGCGRLCAAGRAPYWGPRGKTKEIRRKRGGRSAGGQEKAEEENEKGGEEESESGDTGASPSAPCGQPVLRETRGAGWGSRPLVCFARYLAGRLERPAVPPLRRTDRYGVSDRLQTGSSVSLVGCPLEDL